MNMKTQCYGNVTHSPTDAGLHKDFVLKKYMNTLLSSSVKITGVNSALRKN